MEPQETIQNTAEEEKTQQGDVSAQAARPKDRKQELTTNNTAIPKTFTEEEKQLAEKYKVEPKLIRMIDEIVSEHTAEITELLKLLIANREQDAKEQASGRDKKQEPITGVPFLDELLEKASYPEAAMAYTCLRASWIDNELGDKLQASLRSSVDKLLEIHRKDDRSLDVECDVLPALKWLAFLKGLETGHRDELEIELREPANKEKQPVSQAASAETQEQKPEGEPSLFAVKKWLRKRSYSEKLTAALVGKLIAVESMYEKPDNLIGNDFSRQFEDEVLEASTNEVYLKEAPPDEIAVTAFVLTLMPVRV